MNITYILGNGFDVQMGLKTRYSNFLAEYCKIDDELDSNDIIDFKSYLSDRKIKALWSDAEVGMGKYLKEFSDETVQKYITRVSDFELKLDEYLTSVSCKPEKVSNIKQNRAFYGIIDASESREIRQKPCLGGRTANVQAPFIADVTV